MNILKILRFGYFPKELPPAFSTESFAQNIQTIISQWNPQIRGGFPQIPESRVTDYSYVKKGHIRRKLSIVNPMAQLCLSKYIVDNWQQINNHCNKSQLSASKPVVNPVPAFSKKKRSIKTRTFIEFRNDCIKCSYDKMYELKADISWFYPSIYTHSIPWAIHTKEIAKQNRNDLSNYYGNVLDKYLRSCQSGQTNGIPTGPDTSLIIAEIILCSIDEKLQTEFPNLKGYRYFDDYYFYLSKKEEADEIMKFLQLQLGEFHLVLNEQKSTINKYPMSYEESWVLPLSSFKLRKGVEAQAKDIWKYFNLAFGLFDKFTNGSVLKYAVRRIKTYKIHDVNWDLFESLLLKCILLDSTTIKPTIEILLYYENLRNIDKIKSLVHALLEQHVNKNHSYELSWILWLAKTFEIEIPNEFATDILCSNDVIPQIIALDLKDKGLIDQQINPDYLNNNLNVDSLHEESWLLIYEAIIKGWVIPQNPNILDSDDFFKLLKDNNVSFYDDSKQLDSIEIEDENEDEESYVSGGYYSSVYD